MTYIELMNKVLSAYTDEHVFEYFNRVKKEGLTEHGFPRLTANIGILVANGMRKELLPIFVEMMDFCCENIPKVLAANNFSVREIISAIGEVERAGIVTNEKISYWKELMRSIDPWKCYSPIALSADQRLNTNWTIFAAVSEVFRENMGLCESEEFVDIQIASQLSWFDENGMYKDNPNHKRHQPIVYDLVTRFLLSLILFSGYKGKYYDEVDALLRKAGLLTLKMQSVTGELAFGGRSNQFLHNEAWLAAMLEFEARRYKAEGDLLLAGRFKSAANKAIENVAVWLEKKPIYHIKNRFPLSSKHGCEDYAYFDKYMITCASFLYVAHLLSDNTVEPIVDKREPFVWQTSDAFHKVFAYAADHYIEFDLSGDPDYDASGLGRVHKKGAPSQLCLSMPCAKAPHYHTDGTEDASLCVGVMESGAPRFAVDESVEYSVIKTESGADHAYVELKCDFANESAISRYMVDKSGISITNEAKNEVLYMLPVFCFDGETYSDIAVTENTVTVRFGGWECKYSSDGKILDSGKVAANRNGHYKILYAEGKRNLNVKIEIREINV